MLSFFNHAAVSARLLALLQEHRVTTWLTDPSSPIALAIRSDIGHALLIIMPFILIAWGGLIYCIIKFRASRGHKPATFTHNNPLEFAWTALPLMAVILVMIPAYKLLHHMDYGPHPDLSITVVGHQFFWEFKYPGYGIDRANEALVVPANRNISLHITSVDVIHGFYVPSLGVQMDAVPGHINYAWFNAKPGTYRGQCAMLCGRLHSKMLITVIALPPAQFQTWLDNHAKSGGQAALRRRAQPGLASLFLAPRSLS